MEKEIEAAEAVRGDWLPISEAPENVRLILTFDGIDVYAGHMEDGQVFDGIWSLPDPTHFMTLPTPPAITKPTEE